MRHETKPVYRYNYQTRSWYITERSFCRLRFDILKRLPLECWPQGRHWGRALYQGFWD
jgi:hypothetical protein